MKHLKNFILIVAIAIIIVLIAATMIERNNGTPYVRQNIYTTSWFVLLWAALATASACYITLYKLYKNINVFIIHISFLVILLGALASWITSESGNIHLRHGESTNMMKNQEGEPVDLGFIVSLKNFKIVSYPGTDAPMDYVTELRAGNEDIKVSMNNIGSYNGYRFIQSSYDSDMQGTTLIIYKDTWGICITYFGYAMLFISILTSMFSKRTRIRSLYKKATSPLSARMLILALLLAATSFTTHANAQERVKIDNSIADDFGKLCVIYNDRITPLNTVATNFVTKLCGTSTWDGLSANEVFAGWIFDVPYWETVKMIEIKEKKAQELLGINGKWASFTDFWDIYNNYKLEKTLKEAYKNGDTKLQKQLRDADEKFNIIRMLYNGEMLKMFPYADKQGNIQWFAPGQPLGNVKLDEKELVFIKKSMDYLAESIITGDNSRAKEITKKIYSYQHVRGKAVVPSKFAIYTEVAYNKINSQHFPIMLYLTLSLLLAIASTMKTKVTKAKPIIVIDNILAWVMLIHTTLLLGMRWFISCHLPLSNGYETMQFLSWATLILTILFKKRFLPIKQFGPLLSSFALLVAMITDGNPQVTQLMPVLQSPLLSVHVMVIMFSYALFGLMALVGIEGLAYHFRRDKEREEQLASMSLFMLYPAVSLLAIGIFIGAIWANVSWGRYWSWDSKETWALITMLIYAVPLHKEIKFTQNPLYVHVFMLVAFLSVLMTYFGVNYFLAGLHSYA